MQFDLSYEVSKQINLALSQLDLCSLSCYFKILKIKKFRSTVRGIFNLTVKNILIEKYLKYYKLYY